MKVTILIATYNQHQYISQAIESVLAQTTNEDCEILISDDHSTDGTQEILKQYESNHPEKIRLILQSENKGVNGNYFDALKSCRGEYIFFCEGDDFWINPDKIETYLSAFNQHPNANVVFSKVKYVDLNGNDLGISPTTKRESKHLDILRNNNIPGLSSVAVRNNFKEDLGFWFTKCATPDSIIYILAARPNGILFSMDEVYSCYRLGSGLWSKAQKSTNQVRNVQTLNELEKVLLLPEELNIIRRRKLDIYFNLALYFKRTKPSEFKDYYEQFRMQYFFTAKNVLKLVILFVLKISNK